LTVGAEPPNDSNIFNDIEGHWAHFWIGLNAELGNIAGYEDGSFTLFHDKDPPHNYSDCIDLLI